MERFIEPVMWLMLFLALIWLGTELVDTEPFLSYVVMGTSIAPLYACFHAMAQDAGFSKVVQRFRRK